MSAQGAGASRSNRSANDPRGVTLRSSTATLRKMKGCTMTIQPGEFWVADIPFTSGIGSKMRPVLVLWLDARDAVVAVVTSAGQRSTTDVPLADWKSAGLRLPSTVRLSRLDCLEQGLLIHKLGVLSAADAHQVKSVWSTHVKPGF